MHIPELLIPLIHLGLLGETPAETPFRFWHDTILVTTPPGANFMITVMPRAGYVYLVFGLTMGTPLDVATGNAVVTDQYGFYHSHAQMRMHWDPAVESIYEFDYPQFLEVSDATPLAYQIYNNTAMTIQQDFSTWLYEFPKGKWPLLHRYLRGVFNFFYSEGERIPRF